MFDGAMDDWEPAEPEHHRVASVVAAGLAVLALVVVIAGCAPAVHAPTVAPPATSEEPGFSRFCQAHPHAGTCP